MPVDNPNLDIPIEGENVEGTIMQRSELSLDELATEITKRNAKEKEFYAPKKNPNIVDPLEMNPLTDAVPKEEEYEEEEEETVDQRFIGKTTDELKQMYINLEKLQRSQTDELGTLRNTVKTYKEKDDVKVSLKDLDKKIMPTVASWDDAKREEWNELFKTEPEKALAQVVKELVTPLAKDLTLMEREKEIIRLKKKYANDVVPYVEKDVNKLIADNPEWWNEYGNGIFNYAYNEVRNRDFDKYAAERVKTKDPAPNPLPNKGANDTFVEQQRPTNVITKKKVVTKEQRDKMPLPNALAAIEKELAKKGVKVNKY